MGMATWVLPLIKKVQMATYKENGNGQWWTRAQVANSIAISSKLMGMATWTFYRMKFATYKEHSNGYL